MRPRGKNKGWKGAGIDRSHVASCPGMTESGVYNVSVLGQSIRVFCDMKTGWIKFRKYSAHFHTLKGT